MLGDFLRANPKYLTKTGESAIKNVVDDNVPYPEVPFKLYYVSKLKMMNMLLLDAIYRPIFLLGIILQTISRSMADADLPSPSLCRSLDRLHS